MKKEQKMQEQEASCVVAMMPSPGMGHLIPMLELAKRLSRHINLTVTIIIPSSNPPSAAQTTLLSSLPIAISQTFLPSVSLSDIPSTTNPELSTALTILRSLPSLRRTLLSLSSTHHRLATFIIDPFGLDAIDIASELHIPSYLYFPSSAMALSLALHLPYLDQTVKGNFKDLSEPVHIPGCVPVHGKDLLEPVQERNSESYKCMLRLSNRFKMTQGIINNSFLELEPETFKELQKGEPGMIPVYSVGPLVNVEQTNGTADKCLTWLDEQPRGSVLFVCFGSGGTISSAQTHELAIGLENSKQRFLWVVKCPDKVANGDLFKTINVQDDPLDFLPEGFVERTRGVGLVVPFWAPQAQILAHESIGGFLTHCGWNSILESIVNRVQMIAWPLYAEQKMNAVLITEDIKVATRPRIGENGLVENEEITRVVEKLMEGEEGKKLSYRVNELKDAASKALGENGSSTKQLSELALMWKTTQ
ncbi:hypothetical protein HN51_006215 [Arachis hypogaea]|uniref:Glycosyltransferase n=2 Tax=Arachis TaxID=3817 RepID=A0A6P4D4P6_ARADU|nr:UDP-glycosyltransferase 72B1-like [Arachis duranensis]XP_025696672.1 UDP-glycosyltransferase 72B1 [Arachis hypogaea]QHO10301.1 UDP-glycosyltransferase [Arachis hypogaea]